MPPLISIAHFQPSAREIVLINRLSVGCAVMVIGLKIVIVNATGKIKKAP